MFKQEKRFGLRKAKNMTTLVGTEIGSQLIKKAAVGTIALAGAGLLVATGTGVSADEVVPTNPNPATNLIPAQPVPSEGNVASNNNSGTATGAITGTVEAPNLDEAITNAQNKGVNVVVEEPRETTDVKTAQADYDEQVNKLNNAANQFQSAQKVVSDANQEADDIAQKAAAAGLQTTVNTISVQSADEVDTATNQAANKQIDDYNQATATYTKAVSEAPSKVSFTLDGVETQSGQALSGDYHNQFNFDNNTGNFSIIGNLDDGVGIIGHMTLSGKANIQTTFNPNDNTTSTVITSVTVHSVNYVNIKVNQAVDQHIAITYYTPSGDVIFTRAHDGNTSWSAAVNKTYTLNKTLTLKSGQTSDQVDILTMFDDWVIDSRAKIFIKVKNNNGTITKPQETTVNLVKYTVEAPTVNVHKLTVKQTPTITKAVVNSDGTDVNNQLVPKGSTDPYKLELPTLKGGRPAYTSDQITITDELPSGYKIDVDATNRLNTDYVMSYDAVNHSYTVKLTEEGLVKLNADLNADYTLTALWIVGSPQNDNGKYENTFSLTIGGYLVCSNKVTIYTPGGDDPNNGGSTISPAKKVVDKDGQDIDGKTVKRGSIITYQGKWDLDQYKNIAAGAIAVQKGFGFIDNYDEDAVTALVNKSNWKTADGKTVTGLKAYVITDLSEAPDFIKQLVKNAGIDIKDKDEFVIWVAEDPQDFYQKYVVTGTSLYLELPAEVRDDYKGGTFENTMWQIDFGNGATRFSISA